MPLEWDILLDSVSIKDEIESFNIRESKGSYVRELTLVSIDPEFYNQFTYIDLPTERVEVRTRVDVDWVSQGTFFIEKPVQVANEDGTTSPGVWGRSSTAKAGPPFAQKITKEWDTDTTFFDIVTEVATLCGLTITSEVDNYQIVAKSYVADNVYPIDIIQELAEFIGGYIGCTNAGALVVKKNVFHPTVANYTLTDTEIADHNESKELPDFGNRIRISALGGTGSGYNVSIEALEDSDCLPANGSSKGTLLAFVTNSENEPAPLNTMVSWSVENGATLEYPTTATRNYLLTGKKHKADNFYKVTVDYPIQSVIGIWAYSDSGSLNNYWEEEYSSFLGNTITVRKPFAFCDQTLRITYITAGCAVNKVIAGSVARDVVVSADVEGATDEIEIKLGNTCACGSSLNVKRNPPEDVCLGNLGHILVWATINKSPATGQQVKIVKTNGCGELSSENKILKNVEIRNEVSYAENLISGVTQVSSEIDISNAQIPRVWLKTDTGKTNNLYSSYEGNVIDLNTILQTGTELVIDYHAEGATIVAWRTLGATKDCDATVSISMSDGTESGLIEDITLRAKNCDATELPDSNEDQGEYDPTYSDYGDSGSGGFNDDGNDWQVGPFDPPPGQVDPCFDDIMNRILNAGDSTSNEERDGWRFGTSSQANCPDEGEWGCPCGELCRSEVYERGNTYDHDRTISEIVSETYEKGTPEYEEAFSSMMSDNINSCTSTCESDRLELCGECDEVVGPVSLAPGESAEYVCSNGVSKIITMPEDHCGILTEEVGCCIVDIRSTDGHWEEQFPLTGGRKATKTDQWRDGLTIFTRWEYETASERREGLISWANHGSTFETRSEACSRLGEVPPPDPSQISIEQDWSQVSGSYEACTTWGATVPQGNLYSIRSSGPYGRHRLMYWEC